MGRSIKKGPYVHPKLLKKVVRAKRDGVRSALKTWSRNSTVIPDFVGMTFTVYNGKRFIPVFVTENMVGHKLGEFAPTRTFRRHGSHTDKSTGLK